MAKIARKTQKIFGSTAGGTQIAQFGSLAAAAPAYTTDPETIQALANYLTGWYGAVVGSNSPAIEDMNALCYLYAYQLAYVMQSGVPEWDAETTYYIGSFASDGAGYLYVSLTNDNLNNALTSVANWRRVNGGSNVVAINPAVTPTVTLTAADSGKTYLVNSANGATTFSLPSPTLNFSVTIKDVGGVASANNITMDPLAAETIEGLAANYLCTADYGNWTFIADATNFWLV